MFLNGLIFSNRVILVHSVNGTLKVLLPLPLLVRGIEDGLPLGVVPHPEVVDVPLHVLGSIV